MMSLNGQQFLANLATTEIVRIANMAAPVVRVCGPLTCDGTAGYERNSQRLEAAEGILEERGYTVWKFGDSEKHIQNKNFNHDDIITYFHAPVLESGYITEAFFLPRSNESNGATKERELAERLGIKVTEFPEAWFAT